MNSSQMPFYLFAGDDLTEGEYGQSPVEEVARALYQGAYGLRGEVLNAGRSGDTVKSLLQRLGAPLERYQPHWVVLSIGANDVWVPWLSSRSAGWWLWQTYRRLWLGQAALTDLDQFAAAYRSLIDVSRQSGARVMACTVAPLGERLSSPVNSRVARLNGVIKHVAAECQVPVADIWQAFVDELTALPRRSGYLSAEWLFAWLDRRRMRDAHPDEVAERRRLRLTFDGIHLNSRGAELWAEAVLLALARASDRPEAIQSGVVPQWDLPCFEVGALRVCYTPGWRARAAAVATTLSSAYDILTSQTGATPRIGLALLNQVQWQQSVCPRSYPEPAAVWDGEAGTLFVPQAYDPAFLRAHYVPETVAAWPAWPPGGGQLGEPAKAVMLADLLAIQEMTGLFLRDLRVAPSDPVLHRLLTAYLTQVVLHAAEREANNWPTAGMAGLWNAWGETLARAGIEEGRVRTQAKSLFREHGDGLVPSFTGKAPSMREKFTTLTAGSE